MRNKDNKSTFKDVDRKTHWKVFDNNDLSTEFIKDLKDSKHYLQGKGRYSCSFENLSLFDQFVDAWNLKDITAVFVDSDHALGPYWKINHLRSSKDSFTLHVTLWFSRDFTHSIRTVGEEKFCEEHCQR